ncbi:hypothetical protein QUB80_28265 [Chlorogloeopsis sp. ULAP01]|nr:hypothetical protein [Chlorogloeopsis sp. ULAP01]MDM9384567.1 hypothetical protein [Chlorogloeopsis sp. ULAP01]
MHPGAITLPKPVVTTCKVNIPLNIIQAIIKAHAAAEADINKLAT